MKTIGQIYYDSFMFPFEKLFLHGIRKKLIGKSSGDVLEIGFGTGVNLKYYQKDIVTSLVLVDRNAGKPVHGDDFDNLKVMEADAMKLPFADGSFDTVVFTLVFCSVDDPAAGLAEIRRVLKDGGKILFIEHVVPEGRMMGNLAHRVNHLWNRMSKGCNLDRQTADSISEAGFVIDEKYFSRNGVFVSGSAVKDLS